MQRGLDRTRGLVTVHPVVRFGCIVAQKMLNKIYSNTDKNWIVRAAIILDPWVKLDYFKRESWPAAWSDEAVTCVRNVWNSQYAPDAPNFSGSSNTGTPKADMRPKKPVGAIFMDFAN